MNKNYFNIFNKLKYQNADVSDLFTPQYGQPGSMNQMGYTGIPQVSNMNQMGSDPTGMFGDSLGVIDSLTPTLGEGASAAMGIANPIMAGVGILDSLAGFGASFIPGAEGNYNTSAASYDWNKDYTSDVGEERAQKEATWGSVPVIGGLGSLFSKTKSRNMQASQQDLQQEYTSMNMSNVMNDQRDAASIAFNSASVYSVGGSTDSVYGSGGETYQATMGGTHEQDPMGGTTISYSPDGTPNKIEEGEYVVGDFVFTDRF